MKHAGKNIKNNLIILYAWFRIVMSKLTQQISLIVQKQAFLFAAFYTLGSNKERLVFT